MGIPLYPNGDIVIELPLVDKQIRAEGLGTPHSFTTDTATAVRDWCDAFALELTGGAFEQQPWLPALLRGDFAPELRGAAAEPAACAEMDALCHYIDDGPFSSPARGPVLVRKPNIEERELAARQLDQAGLQTPARRLLRVLLDDDQTAFEHALVDRLIEHRQNVGEAPGPASLLPLMPIALTALAVRADGWQLAVRSDYLPVVLEMLEDHPPT